MIVRDEQEVVGRVLDDASTFCDELVVVDTGSVDDTKQIALDHGAKVYDFEWCDHFGAARNYSFSKCSFNWIIWLDADDRVPPEAQEGFRALKSELTAPSLAERELLGIETLYRLHLPETPAVFSHWRERVVRRGSRWRGAIHETITLPRARLYRWPGAWVEHLPSKGHNERSTQRNLQLLERLASGRPTLRDLRYFAFALHESGRYAEAMAIFERYMDDPREEQPSETYQTKVFMAICAGSLGDVAAKRRVLQEAIELDPQRADALIFLGRDYFEDGEFRKAIAPLTKATELKKPTSGLVSEDFYGPLPWHYLAHCYNALGCPEEAKRCSDEANRRAQAMQHAIS